MKPSEAVKRELLKLTAMNGGLLKPVDVVVAAKPKTSPLHSKFEWDDKKAGHEYRLWQARELITVHVEYLRGTQDCYQVFVSLTSDRKLDGGGYRAMVTVLSDAAMRSQLLNDAFADMERFEQKYRGLKELAAVFMAMRKVRK